MCEIGCVGETLDEPGWGVFWVGVTARLVVEEEEGEEEMSRLLRQGC